MRVNILLWIAGGLAIMAAVGLIFGGQLESSILDPRLVVLVALLAALVLGGGGGLMKRWRLSWVAIWLAVFVGLVLVFETSPSLKSWWNSRHLPPIEERTVEPVDERWSSLPYSTTCSAIACLSHAEQTANSMHRAPTEYPHGT